MRWFKSQTHRVAGIAACLASLLFTGPLAAAGLYRCGADVLTFSDQPCGPDAQLIPRAAQTSAGQVKAAQQAQQREQALAGQLRSQRLERERQAPAAGGATGIRQSPPGLDSTQQMAVAAPAATKLLASGWQRKGQRAGQHKTGAQRDPRVTFEVKMPAPKRNTGKAARAKGTK
jgi:hypothetical protein